MNSIEELPLVALVGPTNAGKSTLFNRLTGSWQAITAKEESTTRDRVYGEVDWQGQQFTVVDTGGLADDDSDLYRLIHSQTLQATDEADLILFIYDAKTGLSDQDRQFLNRLRGQKPIWLVANKVDSPTSQKELTRLNNIGLPYVEISAATGRGCGDLVEQICAALPKTTLKDSDQPLIALVGRPNVGKSTLLNALAQDERAVVSPVAGTTRDVVSETIEISGEKFLLADTAGVRRRGQIERGAEKFSVKRTLAAITRADAVLVLIDATIGTTRGDIHLIQFAKELNKPILLVFNKCDLVPDKTAFQHKFLQKFEQVGISAMTGEGVETVAKWLKGFATTK